MSRSVIYTIIIIILLILGYFVYAYVLRSPNMYGANPYDTYGTTGSTSSGTSSNSSGTSGTTSDNSGSSTGNINHASGTVEGRVTTSPTCPVERIPPDPACAPRGYATSIAITKPDSNVLVNNIPTDANGNFTVVLPAGQYTLTAASGNPLPRCGSVPAEVTTGATTRADISCDSGIR